MILQVTDLKKSYQQGETPIDVLKGLNLSVNKAETVAIVGQSGSGKSTLLSLLAGLDLPSQGHIVLNQNDLTQMDEKERTQFRAHHIGIVFQQFHLMSGLTAFENIKLPLEIFSEPDAHKKAEQALKDVNLWDRKDHFPHQLSGGECQRVAIARAFVVEPKILLADEPSGSLDANTGEQIMEKLFQMVKEKQMTLLLVTHNLELAQQCDQVLTLAEGHLR